MNEVAAKVWAAGWPERLKSRARELGFDSIRAVALHHPCYSFAELADFLGPCFAAVQVCLVMSEEADDVGDADQFIRDALFRDIYEQLGGEGKDITNYRFLLAHGVANWMSHFKDEYRQDLKVVLNRIRDRANDLEKSRWVPMSTADAVLDEVFHGVSFTELISKVVSDLYI